MAEERRKRVSQQKEDDGVKVEIISQNRVTKVTKGGKNMKMAVVVVAGDGNGHVGLGSGKAIEMSEAIRKATAEAKKSMKKISLLGTSIPHSMVGKFGASSVVLIPAPEGTGLIAGGPVRKVLQVSGIKDIRTKAHGSNNPVNRARATLEGLLQLRSQDEIDTILGK